MVMIISSSPSQEEVWPKAFLEQEPDKSRSAYDQRYQKFLDSSAFPNWDSSNTKQLN